MSSHEHKTPQLSTADLEVFEILPREERDRALREIATTKPGVMRRRIINTEVSMHFGDRVDPSEVIVSDIAGQLDRQVTEGMFRKALGWGALVGVAAGTAIAVDIGHTKYVLREGFGIVPPHVEGQLFPNNTLTAEKFVSFEVGGKVYTMPNPLTLTYGEYVKHTVTTDTRDIVTASTLPDFANNPFAADLKLTGEEERLDKEIAENLIHTIKLKDGTVSKVIVEGIASDDFRGELGVANPEQVKLAQARADVAAAVLKQEAKDQGVELPKEVTVQATEAVLDENQIGLINAEATANGMDVAELLSAYNNRDVNLPPSTVDVLGKLIKRGANYTIEYSSKEDRTEYTLKPSGQETDSWKPWVSFGLFGGGIGYATSMIGYAIRYRRVPTRRRKLARKELQRSSEVSQ